jgi:hypothetical protein
VGSAANTARDYDSVHGTLHPRGSVPHLPIEMRDLFCRQLRVIDAYPSGAAAFGIRPCVSSVCATHFNADQLKWRECRDCSAKFGFEEDVVGDGSSVVTRYCPAALHHVSTRHQARLRRRTMTVPPGMTTVRGFGEIGDVCKADLCPKCSVEALRRSEYPGEAEQYDHLCGGFNLPRERKMIGQNTVNARPRLSVRQ